MSAPYADRQPDVLVSALALARRGLHVFPVDHPELDRCAGIGRHHDPATCTERGKHPSVPFTRDASTDPHQVAAWFTGRPRNVGVACGPSGLLVVDEDTDGALARYATSVGQTIPDTFTVATGRGRHFYFARGGLSLGNAEGALKGSGVNIRGEGGFVVGPGSLHATGTLYTVTNGAEAGPVPDWLVDAVSGAARATNGVSSPTAADKPRGLAAVPDVIRGKRADRPGERHEHLVRRGDPPRRRHRRDGRAIRRRRLDAAPTAAGAVRHRGRRRGIRPHHRRGGSRAHERSCRGAVSYTHLTLPTNREV